LRFGQIGVDARHGVNVSNSLGINPLLAKVRNAALRHLNKLIDCHYCTL
jgi:hypothetical protein